MKESTTKGRLPMRPKEAMAAKAKPQHAMPAPQQGLDCCRTPHVAEGHTAARGTHVDGLQKWANMQDETRQPVKAANHMAPAGSATGS